MAGAKSDDRMMLMRTSGRKLRGADVGLGSPCLVTVDGARAAVKVPNDRMPRHRLADTRARRGEREDLRAQLQHPCPRSSTRIQAFLARVGVPGCAPLYRTSEAAKPRRAWFADPARWWKKEPAFDADIREWIDSCESEAGADDQRLIRSGSPLDPPRGDG